MKSPWKTMKPLEPDHEYVVLASSIPPRSMSSTPRLFRVRARYASSSQALKDLLVSPCWRDH